jgi:hypothetical protein
MQFELITEYCGRVNQCNAQREAEALPFFMSKVSSVLAAKSSLPPRSWKPTSLSTAIPFLEKKSNFNL